MCTPVQYDRATIFQVPSDIRYFFLTGVHTHFTEATLNFIPCTPRLPPPCLTSSICPTNQRVTLWKLHWHIARPVSMGISRKSTRCVVGSLVTQFRTQTLSPKNILNRSWEGVNGVRVFRVPFPLLLPHSIPEKSPLSFRFKLQSRYQRFVWGFFPLYPPPPQCRSRRWQCWVARIESTAETDQRATL